MLFQPGVSGRDDLKLFVVAYFLIICQIDFVNRPSTQKAEMKPGYPAKVFCINKMINGLVIYKNCHVLIDGSDADLSPVGKICSKCRQVIVFPTPEDITYMQMNIGGAARTAKWNGYKSIFTD